jgi:hypothetical protein
VARVAVLPKVPHRRRWILIFEEADAVVKHRGVHLDLKGLQPTANRLLALLELFAAARYTFVLVEWEDSFPWTVDERFRSPTAYSPDEITACVERARELGLELIPLVQCLGHMQTPLSVPGYEALREIPDKESDLNPLASGCHCNAGLIQRFREHGCNLWGAGAYKGAEGHDADLPDLPMHLENAAAWVDLSRDTDLVGIVATAWSRYNVGNIQCQPIDACLDSLIAVACVLHDGHLPKDGVQGCIEALASIGERDRFAACRGIMARLAEERSTGWRQVLNARQAMELARHEPRRASARNLKTGLIGLTRLRNIVGRLNQIASEMPIVFDGLMPTVWIDEYVRTRVQPFRDELAALNKEFADLGEPKANGRMQASIIWDQPR